MKKTLFVLFLISQSLFGQTFPNGLSVHDKAPDFTAKNQVGTSVNLKSELKKGAVVLIFYRGQWCPYCMKQLKSLEDSLLLIQQKGATLIAITPEKQENVTKTLDKTKSSFSILSDDSLKIMNAYKVSFQLDPKTTEKYKGFGVNLLEDNGNNGNKLPVPAVYIINKEGKISYRYFDTNYKKRLSVKELLLHL
jgi:peroxiredoxin